MKTRNKIPLGFMAAAGFSKLRHCFFQEIQENPKQKQEKSIFLLDAWPLVHSGSRGARTSHGLVVAGGQKWHGT